jgi:hypothetical protein
VCIYVCVCVHIKFNLKIKKNENIKVRKRLFSLWNFEIVKIMETTIGR